MVVSIGIHNMATRLIQLCRGFAREASRAVRGVHSRVLVLVGTSVLAACGAEKVAFAPTNDGSLLLKSVQFDMHAYNLATDLNYNRVQLHVTALMGDGSAAPAAVRYTASDTLIEIDSTGLLTALHPTPGPVTVTASVTVRGVTRADTVRVRVFSGVPPALVGWLALTPLPGDSAVLIGAFPVAALIGGMDNKYLNAAAYDKDGNLVDVELSLQSSDPDVAIFCSCSFGQVTPRSPGLVWLHLSTYAFGTYFRDSLQLRVDSLRYYTVNTKLIPETPVPGVTQVLQFYPGEFTVPRGSDVVFISPVKVLGGIPSKHCAWDPDPTTLFCYGADEYLDVIFDDPSAASASVRIDPTNTADPYAAFANVYNSQHGSGNIPPFRFNDVDGENPYQVRTFNTPGDYAFHNSRGGKGVIHVR